jgi:predicted DNA-binding protein
MREQDKRVAIRISSALYERLEKVSEKEQRPMANTIRRLLTMALDESEPAKLAKHKTRAK